MRDAVDLAFPLPPAAGGGAVGRARCAGAGTAGTATPPPDPTIEALRQENADLRTELEVSRLRTEIALAMPHVVQAPRGGQKGGSTPKPDGRRST